MPSLIKEVHFLDNNYHRGELWYRSFFPMQRNMNKTARAVEQDAITLDASPYYLAHPLAPRRAKETLPDAKLIVLLRDPVERAFSHYRHQLRSGREKYSFADALEIEQQRIGGELERLTEDPSYFSFNFMHYSYLERGLYSQQIERWFEAFERDRFLFLKFEDFFQDPGRELKSVFEFLGLQCTDQIDTQAKNAFAARSSIPAEQEKYLRSAFYDDQEKLQEMIGRNFAWGN